MCGVAQIRSDEVKAHVEEITVNRTRKENEKKTKSDSGCDGRYWEYLPFFVV